MTTQPVSGHSGARSAFAITALDLVGIGALNLDLLVNPGAEHALPPNLEWGTERSVDAATIDYVVAALGPGSFEAALGGSAFTTIYAVAHARTGLRLGYVGVAGTVPEGGRSATAELDAFGIDRRYVFRDDENLCGVCVSVMRDGERTLLTHAGANATFADHLDREFDNLVAYLAMARLIHVTSFLDDRTPGRLLALLTAVKAAAPETLLSVDPGHVWATERTPAIDGLLRLADFVLVNRRESREIGSVPGVVVVKHPDGARWDGGFVAQVPLPEAEIVDATGAGDVLAAGFLIELARDPNGIAAGCELGMRLARHKLRYAGSAGHAGFAALLRGRPAAGAPPE